MEKNYSGETIMKAWKKMKDNRNEFEAGRRCATSEKERLILAALVSGYDDCIKILEETVANA